MVKRATFKAVVCSLPNIEKCEKSRTLFSIVKMLSSRDMVLLGPCLSSHYLPPKLNGAHFEWDLVYWHMSIHSPLTCWHDGAFFFFSLCCMDRNLTVQLCKEGVRTKYHLNRPMNQTLVLHWGVFCCVPFCAATRDLVLQELTLQWMKVGMSTFLFLFVLSNFLQIAHNTCVLIKRIQMNPLSSTL